ncbi:MAG: VanZ family protein [Christensenellaceae bacterium]
MKISHRVQTIILYTIFGLYILFLLSEIVFKYIAPWELGSVSPVGRSLNLIPFNEILHSTNSLNIYGNILAFLPMGIFLQTLLKNKAIYKSLLIILAVSCIFELFQYIFGIGASDIDDVILNCFGGLLGILSYKLLFLLVKKEETIRKVVMWVGIIATILISTLLIML